jgi:SAM-dependent methyltransferase
VDSVLEVGCAAGATGELLRERGVSRRYGVEIRPELVEMARKSYTEVRAFDAETMDLDWLPKEGVDCIIYPDVLEHFRDPWSALKRHAGYIKPGGFVIASLPNVRYYKAVMDLVWKGDWNYREAGVLDIEHLRFFTLSGALNLIRYAGLEVKEIVRKRRGSTLLKTANLLGFGLFDEFLVKQYIILATKVQEQ